MSARERRRSLTSTIIDPRTTDLIDEPQVSVPALYHAIRVTLEVETPEVRSSSSSIDDLGIREIEREVHQIVEDARQQWSAADRRLRMDNDGCQVELHDWLWFGGDSGSSSTDEQLWVPYTAHYCHRLDYLRANEPNNGRLETDDGAHYVELRAGGKAVQVDMGNTRNFTSVKCVREGKSEGLPAADRNLDTGREGVWRLLCLICPRPPQPTSSALSAHRPGPVSSARHSHQPMALCASPEPAGSSPCTSPHSSSRKATRSWRRCAPNRRPARCERWASSSQASSPS